MNIQAFSSCPHPSRRRARRLPASLLTAVIAVTLVGCGDDVTQTAQVQAPAVEAVQARSGALPLVESLSGVVRARNQVSIRPQISAPIIQVLAQTGDTVREGQPLVRLDQEALDEQVRQAEANLRLSEASATEAAARVTEAEAQVTRSRALHADELISDLELETQEARLAVTTAQANQANARVEQSSATLAERRNASSRAVIRAPVSGRVGQRNAEVGMLADPGTTLFLIGDFRELIAEIPLTEGMLGYIEPGQRVEITTKAWEQSTLSNPGSLDARLSRISPFLSEGSFSTTGEIDLGDAEGRLQPGMFVNARIFYGETETATLVPNSAIWDDPATGAEGVWVIPDLGDTQTLAPGSDVPDIEHRVMLQPITVLARGRSASGVTGIEEGTWVVTVGQQLLSEERSVKSLKLGDGPDEDSELVARVRPTAWERVVELQGLQREDLLLRFLEKQRQVAKALGNRIPSTQESVEDVLKSEAGPSARAVASTPATAAAGG